MSAGGGASGVGGARPVSANYSPKHSPPPARKAGGVGAGGGGVATSTPVKNGNHSQSPLLGRGSPGLGEYLFFSYFVDIKKSSFYQFTVVSNNTLYRLGI